MQYVFDIPASRLDRLSARVAKAAARAPKSGLPVPSFRVMKRDSRDFFVHDALARIRGSVTDTRRVSVPMATVALENFSPTVGEWQIVGWRGMAKGIDGRRFISSSGEIPPGCSGTRLACDHCGYVRKRLETFVVRKAGAEETKQVGSSCVDAFLGQGAGLADGLSEVWSVLREFEAAAQEDLLSSGFLEEEVRTVLALAHRRVRDEGFTSSAVARETGRDPTWMAVCDDLAACRRPDAREEDFPVTAADFLAAADIVASCAGSPEPGSFADAAKAATLRGVASMRDVAVLTAAANAHIQTLRRESERTSARRLAAMSEPAGEKGQRIEFVGKVKRVASFQGEWGERCYVTIFDADGNLMLWKTGGNHGLEQGMAYEMKGTVKSHGKCERGVYEGAVQTELSRVAVIACLGPASFGGERAAEMAAEDEEALDLLLPFSAAP